MAEPILWANKAKRTQVAHTYDPKTEQMVPVVDEDTGDPVLEKVPQRGHSGSSDYDNPQMMRGRRSVLWLRHDGHTMHVPVRNAAAEQDPRSNYPLYMERKARHFGWIPVGHCPIVMVVGGQLRRNQLAAKELRSAKPCTHGTYGARRWCPHYIAEEAARKERRRRHQAKRDRSFNAREERQLEQQREQTTEIVQGVAQAVASAMKGEEDTPKSKK